MKISFDCSTFRHVRRSQFFWKRFSISGISFARESKFLKKNISWGWREIFQICFYLCFFRWKFCVFYCLYWWICSKVYSENFKSIQFWSVLLGAKIFIFFTWDEKKDQERSVLSKASDVQFPAQPSFGFSEIINILDTFKYFWILLI